MTDRESRPPLRVAMLTKDPGGFGAVCAEKLFPLRCVSVVGVVIDDGRVLNWGRYLRRRLKKYWKLGPLAVIPARWIRRAARRERSMVSVTLDVLAGRRGVPVLHVPSINSPVVGETLRTWKTDVGLSLGNSLMEARTFAAARLGTLNVHHAKVPEFRGSPPVIWEIYEGRTTVGYTIHLIDSRVDTGDVLGAGEVPLEVADTLEETYDRTRRAVFEASARGLVEVLEAMAGGRSQRHPQARRHRKARTTPSYRQWRQVLRQFRRMKEAGGAAKDEMPDHLDVR